MIDFKVPCLLACFISPMIGATVIDEVINNDEITTIPSAFYLDNSQDQPAPGIRTGEIRSNQNNLASGEQVISFSLNASSAIKISVANHEVLPGETISFNHSIGSDGRLVLPFMTGDGTELGKISYSLYIDSVRSDLDIKPTISMDNVSVIEGDDGYTYANVKVKTNLAYSEVVTLDYLSKDIDTASIAGEAKNLAYDSFNNPFISIVDNNQGGRLTLDGGFPKFYNQTGGVGDQWRYLSNVWHWLKSDDFGSGVLLLGDKTGGSSYTVKGTANSGFRTSFTTWAGNNGIPITIKDSDDFGGIGQVNISLEELKKYQAVIVMGSLSSGPAAFTELTTQSFKEYSQSGGGLMLITDHDVFQRSVNQIAAKFNIRFYGNINRSPVLVSDLIAKYGNHELWDGLNVIPAGGSEGNVDISSVNFSEIDYEGVGGSLVFTVGETEKIIPIKIYSDTILENDETLSLNITNVKNAVVGNDKAIITIINDD